MPKPHMRHDDASLERELIETMLAGLKNWRPDLDYPESYSDMQALARAAMVVFEIKRRPLPMPLRLLCHDCDGLGRFIQLKEGYRQIDDCPTCRGRGHYPNKV